jgi:uncharacterized protein YjiS (DUF1127 family)
MLQALTKHAVRWPLYCGSLFDRLGTWRHRARERRMLGAFDDHMLKDIGLSRADIESEVSRPFWRK